MYPGLGLLTGQQEFQDYTFPYPILRPDTLAGQVLDMQLSPKDEFPFAFVVHHVKYFNIFVCDLVVASLV